ARDVVLAVGQRALDAVVGSRAHVVAALALDEPPGVISADALPPPELALRALKASRPALRRIGVVYGPRTDALVARMDEAARALGRQAAELANRLLAGEDPAALEESGQTSSLELMVNGDVARRLGVSTEALRALGARIE